MWVEVGATTLEPEVETEVLSKVTLEALVVLQVRVEEEPVLIDAGLAVKVEVGAGGIITLIVTCLVTEPVTLVATRV